MSQIHIKFPNGLQMKVEKVHSVEIVNGELRVLFGDLSQSRGVPFLMDWARDTWVGFLQVPDDAGYETASALISIKTPQEQATSGAPHVPQAD